MNRHEHIKNSSGANRNVVIAGAGAAGLFCAYILAEAGCGVTILESGASAGRKLAISGGGHANFSNKRLDADKYFSPARPDFCLAALSGFGCGDFMELCGKWNLPFAEKEHGRLFLTVPAPRMVKELRTRCLEAGCRIFFNDRVRQVEVKAGKFHIHSTSGARESCVLVLALGSPAKPALAGCAQCWQIPRALGHRLSPARPALVPLRYLNNGYQEFRRLAGIGTRATVALSGVSYGAKSLSWNDDILFTHRGLSGPAILNASLFWRRGAQIHIDFLPGHNFELLLDNEGKSTPRSILKTYLPDRLVCALLPDPPGAKKAAELSRGERKILGGRVNNFILREVAAESLARAEVCAGGVDLREVETASMQSLLWPSLYITGEMLDITGELGGYNLHWAFASANAAARHILASRGA